MDGEAAMEHWSYNLFCALAGVGFVVWGVYVLRDADGLIEMFPSLMAGSTRVRRWNLWLTGVLFIVVGTTCVAAALTGPISPRTS